jgi:hypothetical protein
MRRVRRDGGGSPRTQRAAHHVENTHMLAYVLGSLDGSRDRRLGAGDLPRAFAGAPGREEGVVPRVALLRVRRDLGRGESRSASTRPDGLALARDDVLLASMRPREEPATTASGECPGPAESHRRGRYHARAIAEQFAAGRPPKSSRQVVKAIKSTAGASGNRPGASAPRGRESRRGPLLQRFVRRPRHRAPGAG